MRIASGDIYTVDFGEEYGGHRHVGIRPAIVIRRTADTVLVIPLTSNVRAARFAGTVRIAPDSSNNLEKASIALVFQVQPIDVLELVKKIGIISTPDRKRINEVILKYVSLS